MKFKEKIKNSESNPKGITLMALVVTIVVLLILAAISINLILGDNGIFSKANDAKNRWADAENAEKDGLNALSNKIDEILNNNSSGETEAATENRTVQDEYGNKIVIPAGFKIVAHTGTGISDVTYSYSGDTSKPAVQDGIVIEDNEGNQFVWVPVGNIKNKDGSTTTIELARYTFTEDGTLVRRQSALNYTDEVAIEDYIKELPNSTNGNATALNLGEWISTTQSNGGYYIARYEASKNGDKAASKKSIGAEPKYNSSYTGPASPITDGMLWNHITQPDAATAAQNMYPNSDIAKVYSDLVNSYAWDTAIVFIQKYSGDSDYSRRNSINSTLENTGTVGDKACNIFDMSSNTLEWITETCDLPEYSCTARGGAYYNSERYTSDYEIFSNSDGYNYVSFRTTLCVK